MSLAMEPGWPCVPSERVCMVLPVQGGSWHLAGLGEVDSAELPASPGWAAVALHGVVAALHEAGLYALSAAPLAPPAPASASEDTGSGSDSEELAKQQGWRLEVAEAAGALELRDGRLLVEADSAFLRHLLAHAAVSQLQATAG